MTELSPETPKTLDCLRKVAADTLERKRRLGHYAVIWRDGRPMLIGDDAPSDTALKNDGVESCDRCLRIVPHRDSDH